MKSGGYDQHPFHLNVQLKNRLAGIIFKILQLPLEHMLNLNQLAEHYRRIAGASIDAKFCNEALKELNVGYDVSDADLNRIPGNGRAIAVANHPFGAIEGIMMASILGSARSDYKILANYLLSRIEEMRNLFIFVDPFGGKESRQANLRPMMESLRWLNKGGLLGVFPAGEVSHLHLRRGVILDPPWSVTIAGIIRQTESPVVPIYFDGRNSALFQLAGLINPKLRTALLPRELCNKKTRKIKVYIGKTIPFAALSSFKTDREMIDYIRFRTYLLLRRENPKFFMGSPNRIQMQSSEMQPVIDPIDPEIIKDEIRNLPGDQQLIETPDYIAFYAKAERIPNILREIGRLRELTFRQAKEGTGKMLDLDRFDPSYFHLFVWNRERSEIVGAYRLGPTDTILSQQGINGLYTSTLFKFKPGLFKQINPALELGRSFVRMEYQRTFAPLMLLWKGIGQFVVKNPRYKTLFGPVSINQEYQTASQHLMLEFLQRNNYLDSMAKLVKPRSPMKNKPAKAWEIHRSHSFFSSIDDLSDCVSYIEEDQKGIPVLIRQYLKLGGKFVGFNIDPDFSNVLDGLIIVNLTETDARILEKYMGKKEAHSFLEFHQISLTRAS